MTTQPSTGIRWDVVLRHVEGVGSFLLGEHCVVPNVPGLTATETVDLRGDEAAAHGLRIVLAWATVELPDGRRHHMAVDVVVLP